jgi:hypothetical protein
VAHHSRESPCGGGQQADQLTIDSVPAQTDLTPGTHDIRAMLPGRAGDLSLDLVADFEIENGGCLRAPALSHSLPLAPPGRFVVSACGKQSDGSEETAVTFSAAADARYAFATWRQNRITTFWLVGLRYWTPRPGCPRPRPPAG